MCDRDPARLPEAFQRPDSARLAAVLALAGQGRAPAAHETKAWSVTEWVLYLESLPRPSPLSVCEELDRTSDLTNAKNPEVQVSWLTLACESGYAARVLSRVEEVLGRAGRMKYLKPLYRALARRAETKPLAQSLFAKLGKRYHPIAAQVVGNIVK